MNISIKQLIVNILYCYFININSLLKVKSDNSFKYA